MTLFRSRVFSGGIVTMMLWAFGIFGIYFFTSLYLQDVLGFSPTKAGLAFVPMALCHGVVRRPGRPGRSAVGAHRTVAFGHGCGGGRRVPGLAARPGATFASLMPGFLLIGVGSGLNVSLTNAVLRAMPPERSGIASAVLNASREVSGLLGITVIGAVLRSRQGIALQHGATASGAFVDGYQAGLLVTVALVAAGAVVSFAALRGLARAARPAPQAVPALSADRERQQETNQRAASLTTVSK